MFGNGKEPSMMELKRGLVGKSAEERNSSATASTSALSREIPAERMELEDKIVPLPGEPAYKRPTEPHGLAVILTSGAEPSRWSPEQKEIDACIDSLESEVSQKGMHPLQSQREEWGSAARIRTHHAVSSALLWYAALVVIGCLGWLSYFIYEALN
jgi:hypothetical protein